jgi:galactose mutarotase-like enzyme
MSKQTWTLTDADQDIFVEQLSLVPKTVGGPAKGYSVTKRTLRGGVRQGVNVIEVDNGEFRFVVVPTRGMGLWNAQWDDVFLGWDSPRKGPVHPMFVRLDEATGIGWLDGFDELLCRCGLESNGAPEFNPNGTLRYGLHGKIANLPAHRVDVTIDGEEGEIVVSGEVDEARLFGNKLRLSTSYSTRVGQPGVQITDVVTNLSAQPGELELLYHINFGMPLVQRGGKVVCPIRAMAPRDAAAVPNFPQWDTYGPETPGSAEAVFFFDLAADAAGNTQTLLHNADGTRGVSLKFNKNQLPHFTLWKNRQAAIDGYVSGLEPGTNFPNRKSFEKEKGRVIALAPGESRTFQIEMVVHADAQAVDAARRAVADLQRGASPQLSPEPDPNWSAG